jgi:ketosteroid isomerase-like protein
MTTNALPTIISDYFAASDGGDVDAIVACFANDATVIDEDREWRGHPGIRQWRTQVAAAYEYTVEIRRTVARGELEGAERHDIYTHLEGNFPGGTVDLTNRFGLRDGRITLLEILPTDPTES